MTGRWPVRPWPAWAWAVLAVLCVALAVGLRTLLTARMSLHMLVQIPLLVLVGVFAQQAWHAVRAGRPQRDTHGAGWSINEYGLPGLLLVSLVAAGWMIPKALDDALLGGAVTWFKYLGLPVCGWVLQASVRRANIIIKVFFLGNFCWMSAIVGMVYLDQPVRLCNAYLQDDQEWSGRGLIALAIAWPLAWLLTEIRPIWRFLHR
ncbi:hypothetical protein [Castellaniella sp.]|uniref:hypothetical protein n=1 Tax=Castellaniella sp. TaxID=1955812 RepID=UPI00355DE59A